MAKQFLEGNERFVQNTVAANSAHFQQLSQGQSPSTLWIGCSDSRVCPSVITDSGLGEIFVHRNIANLVVPQDDNIGAVVQYAVAHLKVQHIVVCGHYGCGGMQALASGIDDPAIAKWIAHAQPAKDKVASMPECSEQEHHRLLVQENVRLQLENLAQMASVQRARQTPGQLQLHGWVYDLETCHLEVIHSQ